PHSPYAHHFPTRRSSDLFIASSSFSISSKSTSSIDLLHSSRISFELRFLGAVSSDLNFPKMFAEIFWILLIALSYSRKSTYTIRDRKSTRLNSSHVSISY